MTDRIVITGMGAVTPAGTGVEPLVQAVREGRSIVRLLSRFDNASVEMSRIGGEVEEFDPSAGVRKDQVRYIRKNAKVMAIDIQMAVAAANLAMLDTGLPIGDLKAHEAVLPSIDPARFGMVFGTNFIPTELDDLAPSVQASYAGETFSLKKWGTEGIPQMFPLWLLKFLPNMHACHIGVLWDAQGPSNSLTLGDAGGLLALDECVRIIRRGAADLMLTGGAESRVSPITFLRLDLLDRLTLNNDDPPRASRPFDSDAAGMVAAEGACVVMLERADHAEARGARTYGEVLGTGGSAQTAGVNACEPDGRAVAHAVRRALQDAHADPADLGAILAHGTGLPMQDRGEAAGLAAALDGAAVPVTATKGVTGNMGAPSGVADLMVALRLAGEGTIPPILNCDRPAPGIDLDLVRGEPRPLEKDLVLATTNMVGGQTAAVVVRVNR